MMSLDDFREKVNLRIYSSKEKVLSGFSFVTLLVSVVSVAAILIYYGYSQTIESERFLLTLIKVCLGYYVLYYGVRFIYTFEPAKFLRETRLELILVLFIFLDGITYLFFGFPIARNILELIGLGNYPWLYFLVFQIFVLMIVLIEFAKASVILTKISVSPSLLFIISFLILISGGSMLLMMPEMTSNGLGATFDHALFTAISASCVTGLTIVDTGTYFSLKGQIVIMMLIQLGGLNIITFATFFGSFTKAGVGIRQQNMLKDFMSSDTLFESKGLLRQIILFALIFEVAGTIAIYSLWDNAVTFSNNWERLFYSVFHAISAFNNAGFSLFSDSFHTEAIRNSYIMHMSVAGIIFFGSLGFYAIKDLFGYENLRERMSVPWKRIKLSTQIALYSSILLIVFGGIGFYLLEHNNTLKDQNIISSSISSLFISVSSRTAGFNNLDVSSFGIPTLILIMMLMFIGGSSGSTAGGIKTSTFSIILLSAYSTIRGKRNLEMGTHTISFEILNRAFSIFLFSTGFIFISIFILSLTDGNINIINIAFEVTSAYSTSGLSTGITADISHSGRIIIMICMFVGRVGPLTIAFALSRRVQSTSYKYPTAHLMVG
jgi:trk system potassium uptake protein